MKNNKSRKRQVSSTISDKLDATAKETERKVEIYVDERFYGRIKVKFPSPPQYRDEEDIVDEIMRRMPSLKNENFTISY